VLVGKGWSPLLETKKSLKRFAGYSKVSSRPLAGGGRTVDLFSPKVFRGANRHTLMLKGILILLVLFQVSVGLAYGVDSQQYDFDTHNYLYQNGRLVGAVYRPKLGGAETSSQYTEYWILFKEFVRVGKLVNGKTVATNVIPATVPLRSLKAFSDLYKNRVGSTYVTSYVAESNVPFTEPDGFGQLVQNNKLVGAHWRLGERQLNGSFIEYWVLTPRFTYPSHRTSVARKGMILTSSKDKIRSYSAFLSRVASLGVSKYIKVFCFESKVPFDRQS
jgi:hypothetical protein